MGQKHKIKLKAEKFKVSQKPKNQLGMKHNSCLTPKVIRRMVGPSRSREVFSWGISTFLRIPSPP
jgi:hypothetical protein